MLVRDEQEIALFLVAAWPTAGGARRACKNMVSCNKAVKKRDAPVEERQS